MPVREATTLDHQLKDILRIQFNPICKTKIFQSSFFPYCIKIWNGLNPDLQNIDSDKYFKSKISPFIKIKLNSIFSVYDMYGVKILSRWRLNFSHLNEHKVQHGFNNGINCMCDCMCMCEPQKQHYTFSCNANSIKQ